jgi:hydroxymethylpyrimidine/phosphomethylpyrimidine kinase
MSAKVLTVGESDSCGASGIQADTKTILALGGYAMTSLSSVTSQNPSGIAHLHTLEPWFVEQQMRITLADIGVDAIKTGILVNAEIVNAVADVLDSHKNDDIPVVVDPSIIARRGEHLMDEEAIATLKRRLFVRSTVLTPNLREAELLTGMTIKTMEDMRHAARMLRTLGAENVLLKTGPFFGDKAVLMLVTEDEERLYEHTAVGSKNTLGAGATLSSAIAVSLAQKMDIFTAVQRAFDFVQQAIINAPHFGSGAGPMNHAFAIEEKAAKEKISSPKKAKTRKN